MEPMMRMGFMVLSVLYHLFRHACGRDAVTLLYSLHVVQRHSIGFVKGCTARIHNLYMQLQHEEEQFASLNDKWLPFLVPKLKILLVTVQIVGAFGETFSAVDFPDIFAKLTESLSIFGFDPSAFFSASTECDRPGWDFLSKLVMYRPVWKSSIRLQCARNRTVWTRLFGSASRTRREQSIRPKVSQNDFDLAELENFK